MVGLGLYILCSVVDRMGKVVRLIGCRPRTDIRSSPTPYSPVEADRTLETGESHHNLTSFCHVVLISSSTISD